MTAPECELCEQLLPEQADSRPSIARVARLLKATAEEYSRLPPVLKSTRPVLGIGLTPTINTANLIQEAAVLERRVADLTATLEAVQP